MMMRRRLPRFANVNALSWERGHLCPQACASTLKQVGLFLGLVFAPCGRSRGHLCPRSQGYRRGRFRWQTAIVITACASLLIISSGCARNVNRETPKGSASKEPFAQVGQPVRVSAEERDAAEPAMATSPDGSVYIAWV